MIRALVSRLSLKVSIVLAIILYANPLAAQVHCPWYYYGQSWYLHFNDRSGPEETTFARTNVVLFDRSANIPDSALWKGMCPWIFVLPDWQTEGKLNYSVRGHLNNSIYPYAINYHESLGASILLYNVNETRWDVVTNLTQIRPRLERFKFSILEDEFTFNEAGEVYHKAYGKVGTFRCTIPPETHPCRAGKYHIR